MDNKAHLRFLFKKYIDGTIDKAELAELTSFIDSVEHETLWDECLDEHFQVKEEDIPKVLIDKALPIVDQTWSQLDKQLQEESLKTKTIQPIRRLIKYVAAMVLLFGVAAIVYYSTQNQSIEHVAAASSDIAPGSNRATLTLGDGQSLSLSESQSALVVSKDQITYGDGTGIVATESVQMATIATPRAGQYQITLPDGTKAWLNAASSLTYPTAFEKSNREVHIQGEVYFEVAHDAEKPFIVHADNQKIEVLGTSFNVNAYGDQGRYLTTLVKGSLRVTATYSDQHVLIKPGQQAVVSGQGHIQANQVDTEEYASWKDGVYVINNLTLYQFGKHIERWYDVEVDMGRYKNRKLSATIRRDVKLSEVLAAIELKTHIKFTMQGRRVAARI